MTKLVYIPIEPLAERYTEQWYHQFPKAFAAAGFDVQVIDGMALQSEIKVGTFLDINSTIHYKCSQLQAIAKMFDQKQVEPGTVFFFGDIEFWGIESVRLMADMNKIPVKLTGFLHAASYTKGDAFEIAAPYQQFTEVGWIAALDVVFVGSEYHKRVVSSRRLVPRQRPDLAERIVVSGNPLFASDYPGFPDVEKKDQVVLTNRFDAEKDPWETLKLFRWAKQANPSWTFLITTGRSEFRSNDPRLVAEARELEAQGVLEIRAGLTKDEYHRILAESKVMVSHSPEENYGYCLAESIVYACLPFVRNGASHPELCGDYAPCLFSPEASIDEQVRGLEVLMQNQTIRNTFVNDVAPDLKERMFSKNLATIIEHL